ncbi:sigma-70 family RNA polymerase sigma factor [Candidatus Gracilibacteria bacterium]|nr:sigma-70 family RNA polymerase sigma factor [Candidatus Gracilibacteria bacterium]
MSTFGRGPSYNEYASWGWEAVYVSALGRHISVARDLPRRIRMNWGSMLAHDDLRDIVLRAQVGESAALSEIYRRYAGMMLRYLYARVTENELAQDLTQEVFIRVMKWIDRFEYRDEKAFRAWLYTIATNVLNNHHRRRQLLSTPLDTYDDDLAIPSSPDDARQVCDRVALEQAMQQLTSDQQQVMTLRYFADLSNSEIAGVLRRSEGAIKAIQHRALQSLHRLLSSETDDARQSSRASTAQARELEHQPPLRSVALGQLEPRSGD